MNDRLSDNWRTDAIPAELEGQTLLCVLKELGDAEYYGAPVACTFWGYKLKTTWGMDRIELSQVARWRLCPVPSEPA